MVKCEPCSEGKCENKYKNRHMCKDPKNCTCSCQETATEGFWWGFGSVALGAAAFAGGVALTVSTGGLGAVGIAAVIGGGALTGAGATAAIHPIAKQLNGERMTIGEYAKDVAIGGTIGAITGPIGAGGASATTSIASKVGTEGIKQGAVKLACRSTVGAVSGATASVVQELTSPGEFSGINILKGAALGAATGGVGHVSGNIGKQLSSEVAKSVTKVVTDTAGTAVIDVASQLIWDGEVDGKRLAMNVGARAATSAGYEAVAGATYKAHGGKEALKDKLGDKQKLDKMDPTDKEKVLQAKELLESKEQKAAVEKEIRLADGQELEAAKTEHDNIKKEWNRLNQQTKDEINKINKEIKVTKTNPSLTSDQQQSKIEQLQGEKTRLANLNKVEQRQAANALKCHKENIIEPAKTQMMGEQNVHALGKIDNNKVGQFAADLPNPNDNNNGERGLRRVILDVKPDEAGTLRTKIVAVVEGHSYAEAPGYGQVKGPELNESKPFIPLKDDAEDDKKKKKKQ